MKVRLILTCILAWQGAVNPPVFASDPVAGFAALEIFSSSEKGSEPVLGLVGFYGQPQPPQWLVLTHAADEPGVYRESVLSDGKVLAERKFRKLPGQDLPAIPLNEEDLKVDSESAFRVAEQLARRNKAAFDSAHFQLRCRDLRNEPVWMISLINSGQVSIGVVYVSALTGEVLRETIREPAPVETTSSGTLSKAAG